MSAFIPSCYMCAHFLFPLDASQVVPPWQTISMRYLVCRDSQDQSPLWEDLSAPGHPLGGLLLTFLLLLLLFDLSYLLIELFSFCHQAVEDDPLDFLRLNVYSQSIIKVLPVLVAEIVCISVRVSSDPLKIKSQLSWSHDLCQFDQQQR